MDDLNELLDHALESFSELSLKDSARIFRNIANKISKMEIYLSKEGNYSEKNTLNDLSGKNWLRHTKSWVIFDGNPADFDIPIRNHPATYPPELAEYFIEFFTKKGQWVLDPFMGIGSTAEAAYITGRNCVGLELYPEFADYARKRLKKLKTLTLESLLDEKKVKSIIINEDARNISRIFGDLKRKIPNFKINFVITSPPYWNMLKKSRGGVKSTQKKRKEEGLKEHYGDNPADIGNIGNYQKYLDNLISIFSSIKPFLANKSYLMVILQNIRDSDGKMKPVAWDFADLMESKGGFILQQEFIWCQDQKFLGIWGYPTTYISNVHHHYCLVFRYRK